MKYQKKKSKILQKHIKNTLVFTYMIHQNLHLDFVTCGQDVFHVDSFFWG